MKGHSITKSRSARYGGRSDSGGKTPLQKDVWETGESGTGKRSWFPLREVTTNITSVKALDVSHEGSQSNLYGGITVERSFAAESE